jgi:hypothetical protein
MNDSLRASIDEVRIVCLMDESFHCCRLAVRIEGDAVDCCCPLNFQSWMATSITCVSDCIANGESRYAKSA